MKKTLVLLLSVVTAMMMLSGCSAYYDPVSGVFEMNENDEILKLTPDEGLEEYYAENGDEYYEEYNDYETDLNFWTEDSKAAESIRQYVKQATDPMSDKYVPVEDRIVVFDLDGTLIGELYPSYFEYMMFIHRALYDDTFKAPADMKEFAEALEEGIRTGKMPENNERLHAKYAGQAYAGMTVDELKDYTRKFMKSGADGFTNLTRGDAFYLPMVSLVDYLTENEFQCYVVSGSDRTIVRTLIEDWLPIPENRVIGMSYSMVATGQGDTDGLDYLYSPEDEVILGGDLIIKTIKMNKVSEIALEIGKVPVLAFGNSSGDLSMAQYTVSNKEYEGQAYLVLCDDLKREHGNMDKADSLKETCDKLGFNTISMRDDFDTIYGGEVKTVDYTYDEASFRFEDGKDYLGRWIVDSGEYVALTVEETEEPGIFSVEVATSTDRPYKDVYRMTATLQDDGSLYYEDGAYVIRETKSGKEEIQYEDGAGLLYFDRDAEKLYWTDYTVEDKEENVSGFIKADDPDVVTVNDLEEKAA